MKEYFVLQYRMAIRKSADYGIKPVIAYVLFPAAFIILSFYLFKRTEYAKYIYMATSLVLALSLSEIKRNDFLKTCFKKKDYLKTRITENIITALPFAVFLICTSEFIAAFILIIITPLLVPVNFKITYSFTLPTPFYKKPFEFIIGFRKTIILILLSYILTVIGVSVNNFNLCMFALASNFLIIAGYYATPEDEYFVWCHNVTPIKFLKEKIKTAVLFATYLLLPICIVSGIFFFDRILILLLFILLYYLYLITMVVAKYSSFPREMNLPQLILIAVGFVFPPALIIILPYFFKQSISSLKHFLG